MPRFERDGEEEKKEENECRSMHDAGFGLVIRVKVLSSRCCLFVDVQQLWLAGWLARPSWWATNCSFVKLLMAVRSADSTPRLNRR